jgi:putative tryptophan/tyrosine transport system substrate-binding protein
VGLADSLTTNVSSGLALFGPDRSNSAWPLTEAKRASRLYCSLSRCADFEAAFATATQGNAQAFITFDDALTNSHRTRIAALAASNRLPAMYGLREFPDDGGLMSYGPNFVDLFRRAATFVDNILKGARPADLPVEQPTKFEFVINRKAANALGVAIPSDLLAIADDVIE